LIPPPQGKGSRRKGRWEIPKVKNLRPTEDGAGKDYPSGGRNTTTNERQKQKAHHGRERLSQKKEIEKRQRKFARKKRDQRPEKIRVQAETGSDGEGPAILGKKKRQTPGA